MACDNVGKLPIFNLEGAPNQHSHPNVNTELTLSEAACYLDMDHLNFGLQYSVIFLLIMLCETKNYISSIHDFFFIPNKHSPLSLDVIPFSCSSVILCLATKQVITLKLPAEYDIF